MTVAIDPQTGEIGLPTPEEAAELEKAATGPLDHSSEGLQVVRHPDGHLSVDLQGRFMSYSVARLGPDGRIHMQCVSGEKAAREALCAPVAPVRGAEVEK